MGRSTKGRVLLDERAAAQYLGGEDHPVSPATLRKWRWAGLPPAFLKINGLVRYDMRTLDELLEAAQRNSAAASPSEATP